MRAERRHALGRRVDVHERVALPGPRARLIGVAAPQVDDGAAVDDDGDGGADLVPLAKVLLEDAAHALEGRVARSVDRGNCQGLASSSALACSTPIDAGLRPLIRRRLVIRRRHHGDRHVARHLPERDCDLREAHEECDARRELDDLLGREVLEQLGAQRRVVARRVAQEGVGEAQRRLLARASARRSARSRRWISSTSASVRPASRAPEKRTLRQKRAVGDARVAKPRHLLGRLVEHAVAPERAVEAREGLEQRRLVRERGALHRVAARRSEAGGCGAPTGHLIVERSVERTLAGARRGRDDWRVRRLDSEHQRGSA